MTTENERQSADHYANELCRVMQIWGLKREQARAIFKEAIGITKSRRPWNRMRNHEETLSVMRDLAKSPEDHARIAEIAAQPILDPWSVTDAYVDKYGETPFKENEK